MTQIAPYRARVFRFESLWNIDDLRLKFYTITTGTDVVVPIPLLTNARAYATSVVPGLREAEGADHCLGYGMLHLGEMSNWLLIHWWAHQDIALRLLASAEIGMDAFSSQDHRRFHACVWEHVVIAYERDAWVRTMMATNSRPQDYLTDRLPDGVY